MGKDKEVAFLAHHAFSHHSHRKKNTELTLLTAKILSLLHLSPATALTSHSLQMLSSKCPPENKLSASLTVNYELKIWAKHRVHLLGLC